MNIKGILICFNINFEQKKSLDVAWFWRTTTKRQTILTYTTIIIALFLSFASVK